MTIIRRAGRPQQPEPEPGPIPDFHPAQVELLNLQDSVYAALGELDGWLREAGNGRPFARDALLAVRHWLTSGGPVTP